ncbi:unnamed protein product [Mytilus coruscus]|uniref:CUB domain-containing protein n=1 Tax=Mytilus coruscus TaxID=42192 RepID=A0A6J7ZV89_MYTCO|nr:unnamed protein product [Mytilus coruscus]
MCITAEPLCSSSLISLTATPLVNTFTSHPGYDGHVRYPDGNYTQDWYITTNWINHTIKINFATCFIENAKGVCLFDFLYVYDGANSTSPEMLKTCCGTVHSATLESTTGEMYILFVTDNTEGDTGFEIEYWSNGITTTTTTTTVAPSTDTSTDSTYTTTVHISSAGKTKNSASSSATSDTSDASVISTIKSSSHDPEANTVSTILAKNIQTTTGNFSQTFGISTSRASGSITGGSFSTETHNPNAYSSTVSLDGSSTIINKETVGT